MCHEVFVEMKERRTGICKAEKDEERESEEEEEEEEVTVELDN